VADSSLIAPHAPSAKTPTLQNKAFHVIDRHGPSVGMPQMGDTGLEPGPSYSEKTPPFEQGRYEGVIFPVPLSFGQAGLDHGVRVPSASVMLTTFGVLRTQHWTLYSVPFLRRPDRGRE